MSGHFLTGNLLAMYLLAISSRAPASEGVLQSTQQYVELHCALYMVGLYTCACLTSEGELFIVGKFKHGSGKSHAGPHTQRRTRKST